MCAHRTIGKAAITFPEIGVGYVFASLSRSGWVSVPGPEQPINIEHMPKMLVATLGLNLNFSRLKKKRFKNIIVHQPVCC